MTGFRDQGQGTPLMLLHGISSGAASWHKQMALSGYRVLAWDMPGYGESPMLPVEQADAGDYADALAQLLDRASVAQTVLVGHSLGALVASAFAAKYPQRVRYLVLADAAQGYGQAEAQQREKVWHSRQQLIAQGAEVMASTRAAKLLHPARRRAISPPWPPACARCVVRATLRRRGCWRTTIFTAGLVTIAAGLKCGAASRTRSLSPNWFRGWRCATACRTPLFRRRDMPAISIMKPFLINSFYE